MTLGIMAQVFVFGVRWRAPHSGTLDVTVGDYLTTIVAFMNV